VLYELVARAAEITRGSKTRLLVNDRSDIARAAGADGVHLTTQSLPVEL
jgi:thiamine-phosphate pyrophosphorylase